MNMIHTLLSIAGLVTDEADFVKSVYHKRPTFTAKGPRIEKPEPSAKFAEFVRLYYKPRTRWHAVRPKTRAEAGK